LEDGGVPEEATAEGYSYLLETPTMLHVLEELAGRAASLEEKCDRVIEYAIHDA
jgi:hypothetical protein